MAKRTTQDNAHVANMIKTGKTRVSKAGPKSIMSKTSRSGNGSKMKRFKS